MAPMISPEDKYLPASPLPELKTIALEIPAESCPVLSPTVPEPNMELFNNNILKHGTLIQAGHCKPYHEETKPFEMSDFYKYSTKFNRSPSKQRNLVSGPASPSHVGCANGDNHTLPPAKPTVLNKWVNILYIKIWTGQSNQFSDIHASQKTCFCTRKWTTENLYGVECLHFFRYSINTI